MSIAGVNKVQPMWATDAALTRAERPAAAHDLVAAVEAANEIRLLGEGSCLAFRFDRETGRRLIEARDRVTGEVISQIPPENLLHVMQTLLSKTPQKTLE